MKKLVTGGIMDILLNNDERIDDLQINNLKIIQNINGFCFSIDSVLLSDFAKSMKSKARVIDLGTGTGAIAILLTAKTKPELIIGVEIQKKVADMAGRSVILNKLEDKIKIINEDIRNLDKILEIGTYDTIVTNPPYIKKNTGAQNINSTKLISRHEVECSLEDIARISGKLLKDNGEVYMVHRPERLVDIMEIFRKYKLEIKEMRLVFPTVEAQANLVLIKAVKNGKSFLKIHSPLIVYKQKEEYSDEVLKIYNKDVNQ